MNLFPQKLTRYFQNTSILVFEKIFRVVIGFFIWGRLANELGQFQFGVFSYFQAILSLLIPFSVLGVDHIIRAKIADAGEMKNDYIYAGIQIKILLSVALIISIILYSIVFSKSELNNQLVLIFFSLSLLFRSISILEFNFDNKLNSIINSSIRSLSFLMTSGLYLIGIYLKSTIYFFALIYSFEFFLNSTLLFLYSNFLEKLTVFKTNRKILFEILSAGIPIFICDVAISVFLRINQIFLGQMISNESVAIYIVALKFVEAWYFLPSAIIISVYPLMSKKLDFSNISNNKKIQFVHEIILITSILIVIFNLIIGDKVIWFFYGQNFANSHEILIILCFSVIFTSYGIAQEPIDVGNRLLYWRLFRVSTGALLNLILNYILIHLMGIRGAAVAIVITLFYTYIISNIFFSQGRMVLKFQFNSIFLRETVSLIFNRNSKQ